MFFKFWKILNSLQASYNPTNSLPIPLTISFNFEMDEYHLRTVIQLAFKFYLDNFLISLCCYCNFFCYSFCYSRPLCFPRFHRMVTPAISWSRALVQISPYTFAVVGIAVAIRVSTLGTAR